ncbi:MAG TPA: aminotransferase class IV [Dokdonella sp.]|nr:aminotransferase class IV [Dokdonella sp.]
MQQTSEVVTGGTSPPLIPRILLNGRAPTIEELAVFAQVNYGHFTTLQVIERRARGFSLHLQRLVAATRELFGSELDTDRLRTQLSRVIGDAPLSLRISVFSLAFDRAHPERPVAADVLIATRPVRAPSSGSLRLKSMTCARVLPHLKHVGMFDVLQLSRQARIEGFDDVLLTTSAGAIAEGSTWNIGFWDGRRVTWPNAPALRGTTLQLIERGLREQGIESVSAPLHLDQLGGFRSAFMLNAGSVGPMIESIDAHALAAEDDVLRMLKAAWESQPLELI